VPTKSIEHRLGRGIYQHSDIRHALATLLTKETTIALYEMNKQAFYLALEIRGQQIDAIPGSKIHVTEEEPNFLAFASIYRSHTQGICTVIEKSRIAKIGY
jgi:hypothetical protein